MQGGTPPSARDRHRPFRCETSPAPSDDRASHIARRCSRDSPIVFGFGFSVDAREPVLKVVQSLRVKLATTPPEFAQAALDLAALIAAQNRDSELADAVAAVAVERFVLTQDVDRLLPTAAVILECAAARTDRTEALSMLARRLENLAFVAPAAVLPEALDIFRILQSINAELAGLLGRSIATSRLGLHRVAVA